MVEQFFLVQYTNLYLKTICFSKILLSLHSHEKTAIKSTNIRQQSSADPIFFHNHKFGFRLLQIVSFL